MSDHYATLGVRPDADLEEIKNAYWALAKQHHVVLATLGTASRRRADDEAKFAEAERELARLDEAYAVLVDPAARLDYNIAHAGADLSHLPGIIKDAAEGLDLDVEVGATRPRQLPTRPACVVCGGVPAAPAVLKEVTGMLVRYRVDAVREAFCNRCGTAAYRTAQGRTLLRGWWGLFALFHNFGAVAANWAMAKRLATLPEPSRPGKWPDGSLRPPLDPGAPLWQRPKLLAGGAVLVVLIVAAVADTFVL